jgi:RNA polymerase sigma-70 factor (ECF subfamily)
MTAVSDAELLKRFHEGDESAFTELIHRYREKIYWLARRFQNDHDSADEVTQEVFCKAYESLKDFRGESGVYTWLYRITVNASLNALRRHHVRSAFSGLRLDDYAEHEASGDDLPDEAVEKEERRALIEEAIQRLPKQQKAVFILRYYDELSYEEIAHILKRSVGGLKANYFHALKKIGEYVRRAEQSRTS